MEKLEITKDNALKAFNNGSDSDRALLKRLFPGKLEKKPIIERMHDVEDACQELGTDFDDLYDDCEDEYEEAEKDIKTFAEALREGKPASECFYYPYFYRSSGGGFSYNDFGHVLGCTNVGARLRVDTPEKAKHLGKCMEKQYKIYLNGQ